MANKSKNQSANLSNLSKQELEIEKLRDENKWSRLKEYTYNVMAKDTKQGLFCASIIDLYFSIIH
jgi:hypothetical protein